MKDPAPPAFPSSLRTPASKTNPFNRNVVSMAAVSLLSDIGHEMVTTMLPGFLAALGLSAGTLGAVEGIADSISSFVKLGGGWLSDRMARRKPLVVSGYVITGVTDGLFALAHGWPLILFSRAFGWFGRGVRGPAKKAILASSVREEARGRAFGLERTGDTIGAIAGPLLSVILLAHFAAHHVRPDLAFRRVFLISLIPGLGAALAFGLLVRDPSRPPASRKLMSVFRGWPVSFRRFLAGVGLFGMGDYARTLMILAATELLAPRFGTARAAAVAGLLYVGHNVCYAAASYPAGAASDRIGRRGLLAAGYGCGGLAAIGFAIAFYAAIRSIAFLLLLFAIAGVSIAIYDALEDVITAGLAGDAAHHGSAFGLLGAVNGAGDLVASVLVGLLWSKVSPVVAFAYGAFFMILGAGVIMWRTG